MSVDPLAQERDAKFKVWLQNKALRDKAFEFLARLDSNRATEEDSLVEVAVSLCAIDRLLGNEEERKKIPATSGDATFKDPSATAKKTLKSSWFRWTMEHYSFSMIHLSDKDVESLSGAVKEFLFSESDIIASAGNYGEELDKASRVKNILPSLKYFFPQIPKPNEKARPLTNDQKAQNLIYMREARKLWRKAGEELNNRIVEYVARAMKTGKQGKPAEDFSSESERKMKHDAAGNPAPYSGTATSTSNYETAEEKNQKAKKLELQCLSELSLKQLKIWIEEDEDKKTNKANEDAMEKLKMAKQSHEQFVKKKDGLRIRLPETLAPVSQPTMGYGREMSGVRATAKGVSTTVDLMAGMGLKYVHATNKGRKGQMGDLEKSREQLLKMGFVDKANFNTDEQDNFERERRANNVIKEKKELEMKQKLDNKRAYDEWIAQKELRDSALKCISLIPKPVHENSEDHYSNRTSMNILRKSQNKSLPDSTTLAQSNPMFNPDLSQHCIEVGRAMKKVDRTTFLDWARWCENIFSSNTASVLWDAFAPIACDVHCASYSQVRDTFLKLLRPGVDYRQTFMDYVEKHIFARRINRFKDQKDYYRLREDAQQELDEEIEALRKEWLSEVALSKEDMNKLLLSMGILLKETEMRTLIDAFDSNNDGVVTIMEFLDFTGSKRDKRGNSNNAMSQRCCWLTTCKITGMANAYSVSAPTKRFLSDSNNLESSKNQRSSEYDEMYQKNMHSNNINNTSTIHNSDTIIRKLSNGETRVCIELKERKKREDLLKKMGLIKNDKVGKAGIKKSVARRSEGKEQEEDQYEDDFAEDNHANEEYGDDFDQDEDPTSSGNKTKSLNPNICQYSTWRLDDRKEGLKVLLDMTKEARQEETLKTLLANGVPPAPPKLWIQNERNIETKSLNRRSLASSARRSRGEEKGGEDYEEDSDLDQADVDPDSTEITLFWGPHKGDLVSFYSLEYGGPVGATKTTDVKYTEIYRDPPDADPNNTFDFAYTLRNLTPGASYRFRMRAFNGFGAGGYTYKTFTTITAAPAQPHMIKLTSDSVCLKWTFSHGFFRRLDELRRIFTLADSDQSGMVSREELTALLDERASSSPQLKAFLSKVAQGLGLVVTQGYDALFDMIEGDDDGGLSWTEFEGFFMAAGWGNQPSVVGNTGTGTANFSTGMVQSNLRPGQGPAGPGIAVAPGDINYVVERCESEIDDKYVEVLRTTLGYGTLTRLDPAKSYRFRVYSLNADGIPGPCSPPVLVHTLVETPAVPTAPNKLIQARKVTITWKPRNVFTGTRNKAFTDKMLDDWAGALGDDESGVSIRAAFDKYDRDQSGGIDPAELKAVLEDLGVDASEERLTEAFEILDKNNDGVISYEEFGKWWRRDGVSYTLKRSEEIIPVNTALYTALDNGTNRFRGSTNTSIVGGNVNTTTGGSINHLLGAATRERATSRSRGMGAIAEESSQQRSGSRSRSRPQSAGNEHSPAAPASSSPAMKMIQQAAVPIVVYRGERTRCDVMGLTPNRLYHFKLRYVGSRSNSILSPPLVLMTAPLPTSCPVLIDCTSSTVRVKWYPGQYGAFKFIVHMRLASDASPNPANNFSATNINTTTSSNMNNATRKVATGLVGADTGEEGWIAVYNGQDNVYTAASLASNTAYQLRVFAVNCQGVSSEASEVINFTTNQRTDKDMTLTPKNAGAKFTIECTGDICVGDVILITERLFVKNRPSSAGTSTSAATAGVRTSLNSITGGLPPKSRSNNKNNTTAPVAQAKSGALMMNMSVTSLSGAGLDASITSRGAYLGERTIAAYVARDNYRTIRDALTSAGIEPKNHKKFGSHRKLWLEVVWQRTSDEACKPYDLKSGEVLERLQSHLEQFEVFRCSWKDEINRKTLQDEWKTMIECYIQTNC